LCVCGLLLTHLPTSPPSSQNPFSSPQPCGVNPEHVRRECKSWRAKRLESKLCVLCCLTFLAEREMKGEVISIREESGDGVWTGLVWWKGLGSTGGEELEWEKRLNGALAYGHWCGGGRDTYSQILSYI